MRRFAFFIAALLIAVGLPACTHHDKPVEVADSSLGRVVVYRNGIAYFERKATASGGRLSLRVPADKVDDFLKSLTVTDARSGKPLTVAYPSKPEAKDGVVDMAIELPRGAGSDVKLTYITEAPAWKPSYRVVMGKSGEVDLEGWAIVDNTSGEDWQDVKIGVGASSALSFRYDLHSIRSVQRETLSSDDTFAKAPPRGGSVLADGREEEKTAVLAALKADEIPDDVTKEARDEAAIGLALRGPGVGGGGGSVERMARTRRTIAGAFGKDSTALFAAADSGAVASIVPAPQKEPQGNVAGVQQLAQDLKQKQALVTIEAYASAGEPDAQDKAAERGNKLRNQLIELGVAPGLLNVAARGVVAGQSAGVRLVQAKSAPATPATAAPAGESHFESPGAMTVEKGRSAMVSVLRAKAKGEVVYLYDGESSHGDEHFAFRAARFVNPTTSTLESGPLTVYGAGRFIGEGLTDPIPPGATAVVPFALDRQVVVEREASTGERMDRMVKLVRGALTCEVQHVRTSRLKIHNRLAVPTTVLVRHTVEQGWTVREAPPEASRFGDARLYAVQLAAGEQKTVTIEDATPLERTVDLRTPDGMDLVQAWLQAPAHDPRMSEDFKRIVGLHQEMARSQEQIDHLRERQAEYRSRADELGGQIFQLKLVKTAGSLMVHLQQKMKDASQQVHDATGELVDAQERLMVARVKFQDALAELTLARQTAAAPAAPQG